ncbi:TonB family protein [Arenibacterium sp. LLYu02]|uniref:TonB family protein n=1 Tax=Arenibacterium sp. LLYu02 TaxID=3404132 RepID=UPI003B2169A6
MKRWIEGGVFAGVAVCAHVALFASVPEQGSEAGGSGGDYVTSIAGAAPTVREMVTAWERPPETPVVEQYLSDLPDLETPVPDLPQLDQTPAPRAEVQLALIPPQEQEQPEIDTETAAPPPEPEPEPEAAKPAKTTTAGRAEQRAAGSGGSSQAGLSGQAKLSTANSGQLAQLEAVWGAKIRAKVERRKRIPPGVRGEGQAVVAMTVSRSGQLVAARLARSSGVEAFDAAALKAVASAGPFPAAPAELTGAQYSFNLPISFSR